MFLEFGWKTIIMKVSEGEIVSKGKSGNFNQ